MRRIPTLVVFIHLWRSPITDCNLHGSKNVVSSKAKARTLACNSCSARSAVRQMLLRGSQVGSTISCEGTFRGGDPSADKRTNAHVQSYAMTTDQVSRMHCDPYPKPSLDPDLAIMSTPPMTAAIAQSAAV